MAENELQKRTCRTCGESYDYPGHKSIATRFQCERCVQIPEDVQRVLELMRRKIDRLTKEVQKLSAEKD